MRPVTQLLSRALRLVPLIIVIVLSPLPRAQAIATVTVTSNADGSLAALASNSTCDLREAIQAVNTNFTVADCVYTDDLTPGPDLIRFAFTTPQTITLTSALPALTEPVDIDGIAGTPEASGAVCPFAGGGPNLFVEIDANSVGVDVLLLNAGSNGSTIRGLALNNAPVDGIQINSNSNTIICNMIGTDLTGTIDKGNASDGVDVLGTLNRIGGPNSEDGNLISGNGASGIQLNSGNSSIIEKNYIGTTIDGLTALSNDRDGIQIRDGDNSTIAFNLISGNGENGIELEAITPDNISISTNIIGTDAINSSDLGNGDAGVFFNIGYSDVTITDNVIRFNQQGILQASVDGVGFAQNNCILSNDSANGLVNNSLDTFDARNNWWGDVAGPTGPLADMVTGPATTSPFLTSAILDCPSPPFFVTASALPGGTTGTSYSQIITTDDTNAFDTLTLACDTTCQGNLPPGLTFTDNNDRTGTISGTPSAPGTFTFALSVNDGFFADVLENYTIIVTASNSPPFFVSTSPLASGTTGTAYAQTIVTDDADSGDVLMLTCDATCQGNLPPGLTFLDNNDRTGTISGTPTVDGNYTFSLSVNDGTAPDVTASYSINVTTSNSPPFFITASPLASGTTGTAYAQTIVTDDADSGDVLMLTCDATCQGNLPPGLTFLDNNDRTGTISGTPLMIGSFAFSLTVSDQNNVDVSQAYTLMVGDVPPPAVDDDDDGGDEPDPTPIEVEVTETATPNVTGTAAPATPTITNPTATPLSPGPGFVPQPGSEESSTVNEEDTTSPQPQSPTESANATPTATMVPAATEEPVLLVECGFVPYETRSDAWMAQYALEVRRFTPVEAEEREVLACPEPPTGTVCFPRTNRLYEIANEDERNLLLVDITDDETAIFEAPGEIIGDEVCIDFGVDSVDASCTDGCALAPQRQRLTLRAIVIPATGGICLAAILIWGLVFFLIRRRREEKEQGITDKELTTEEAKGANSS